MAVNDMITERKKNPFENLLNFCLYLLLFLLPWQTILITKEQFINGSKWEYGTLGFYATEGLLWFCIILFIALVWHKIKEKKAVGEFHFSWTRDRKFILACTAFIVYTFCSALWSSDRAVAWQHALRVMEAFLLFFMLTSTTTSYKLHTTSLSFIVGSVVQSILAIWQFLTQSTFSSTLLGLTTHPAAQAGTSIISTLVDGRWLRAYGAFPHPNMLGGYLVIGLILTDMIRNWKLETGIRVKPTDHLFSIFYFLVSSLQITALFFTFSRSAWLAAGIWIVGSCIMYHVSCIKNWLALAITRVILIIILTLIFSPLVFTRLNAATANESRSYAERMSGYQEAFALIKEHPLTGVGIGNYTAALYQKNSTLPGYAYQPVHNLPLLLTAELGLVGIILILLLIAYRLSSISTHFYLFPFISIAPLFLFDHYLFSSYSGVLLTAIFFSTGHPHQPLDNHLKQWENSLTPRVHGR